MTIDRRQLMTTAAALTAASALPRWAHAQTTALAPKPGNWRTFETVMRVEVQGAKGVSQAWLPIPSVNEAEWFKSGESTWTTNAAKAKKAKDAKYGVEMLHVAWADGEPAPVVELTSRFSTRDRGLDLSKPGKVAALSEAERKLSTSATELIPGDGIVKETAEKIVANAKGDMEKARAIYEWVVDNTFRDPKTRGCGVGDISSMLKTGNLKGKCADLNALYVGLARASGLPARDVYGVRVGPSKFGYKSLGPSTEVITKAQHCRAEVWLSGFGWVPVDPADVRKVVLEEPPGNLPLDDQKVKDARTALFGGWEMNWLAYNTGHDIALPGSSGPKLGFLMYPQVETAGSRVDCLDPDNVKYKITSREIVA